MGAGVMHCCVIGGELLSDFTSGRPLLVGVVEVSRGVYWFRGRSGVTCCTVHFP